MPPRTAKTDLSPDEKRAQQVADDRAAELARQKEVHDAMEAFYAKQAAAAKKALDEQASYEVTGIRKVDNA